MEYFNPQPGFDARVLATDLDGTFIPLPDNKENQQDLKKLAEFKVACDGFAVGAVFHFEFGLLAFLEAF